MYFIQVAFFPRSTKSYLFHTEKVNTYVHLVLSCVSKATEIIRSCDNFFLFYYQHLVCSFLLCYCTLCLTHLSFRTLTPNYIYYTISCQYEVCLYCHVMLQQVLKYIIYSSVPFSEWLLQIQLCVHRLPGECRSNSSQSNIFKY